MKLDKETLIKHRFWVLLGLEVPLVLIATAVLLLGVRSRIAAREAEVKKHIAEPANFKGAQNQSCVDEWQKREDEVTAIQEEVWKDAWDEQAVLVTWPRDVQQRFTTGLYATKLKVNKDAQGTSEQPLTEKEARYLFRGVVQAVPDQNTLKVLGKVPGKDAKNKPIEKPVIRTFYFTPGLRFSDGTQDKEIKSFSDWVQPGAKVEVTFLQGKFFGDDFTLNEKQDYTSHYDEQFKDLDRYFRNAKGQPLVLLRDGKEDGIPKVIRRKSNWSPDKLTDPRTHWEIWYAQEDFWIQRGMLEAMQKANDFVARFEPAEGYPNATAEKAPFIYRNPYWQLDLVRKGDQITGTLKNISRKKLRLDLTFLVQVSPEKEKPHKWELKFPGETLASGKSTTVTGTVGDEPPRGIFGVEQVLTLDTAPVKRLDDLKLGEHSHRTLPKGLQMWYGEPQEKKEANTEEQAAGPGPAGGGSGGPANMYKDVMKGKMMRPPGQGAGGAKEEEQDIRKRYSLTTKQFRRMPVAMVLLVDQDSAGYVLTALEESRLRFQVTQVALTRYPEPLQPDEPDEGKKEPPKDQGTNPMVPRNNTDTAPPPPRGGSRGGPPMMRASMAGPRLPSGKAMQEMYSKMLNRGSRMGPPTGGIPSYPQLGPTGGGEGTGSTVVDEQGPIMELTVYGYVTLYERYPPQPPEAVINKPAQVNQAETK